MVTVAGTTVASAIDAGNNEQPKLAASAPLIQMQTVSKRYGNGTQALSGMSLDIGERQFVSFLGPSGCGKSTALRMIAGLSDVSSGTITWPQPEVQGAAAAKRHAADDIGFVFQEPTLMPWSRVFDNVYLPLRLKGIARKAAAADVTAALEMVGLGQFANVFPRELSGGMKMRVSIARALVMKPRVLLMDEPFAALDEMTRFKLNNDLLDLWTRNRWTVIFVTHSVYESVYLSNRIVIMAARPGRVIADVANTSPYPRDASYRATPAYNQLCLDVSERLHAAMPGGVHE
jgi:NitT/TauT family transport system ATP-binding protein